MNVFKGKINLLIALFVYFFVGALLLKWYQYYVISDIVPYIAIAQKYIQGDFIHAINGIWGVLISWLLIPFLLFGIKPILAFKLLNLCIGGLTLFGIWLLGKKFTINAVIQSISLYVLVPIIWSFALVHTTPDLLVVCILVFYLNIIFNKTYHTSVWNAVYAGLLGGFGYLAKHYVFCFIALHLPLSHVFKYVYQRGVIEKRKVLVNGIVSFFIFIIISSFWVIALSNKYGFFTIGTSPSYNHAWMAPGSKGQGTEYLGFLPPPNSTASSMWEDLTFYTKLMPNYNWSPLSNWPDFKFQLKLVFHNVWMTLIMFAKFSFLWPVIVLFALWHLFKIKERKEILNNPFFLSLVVAALYSIGYTLIVTSDRYLWIVFVLLFLMTGSLLSRPSEYFNRHGWQKVYWVFALVVYLTFLLVPLRRLVLDINSDKSLYEISNALKQYNLKGNIASDEQWTNTLIMSFYLGTKYYGIPGDTTILPNDFRKYGIDYYFVYNQSKFNILSQDKIVAQVDNLTVYKVGTDL